MSESNERTHRVIKRYANRKLYDTRESRYVTLEQISGMIRQGEDIKVVDNNSKEDLTSVTLAQIIFEEEKKQRSFLPLVALRNIIQSGGESFQELVSQLTESAERMGRVFRHEASERQEAGSPEEQPETERADPAAPIRDFMDGIQKSIEDWQRRLDSNLHAAMESVSPLAPLQKELQTLRDRIADLERKLGQLEGSGHVGPDNE